MSSAISLVVAIAVLVAAFFQWWDVSYDGDLRTRPWVKVLLGGLIALLVVALVLLLSTL